MCYVFLWTSGFFENLIALCLPKKSARKLLDCLTSNARTVKLNNTISFVASDAVIYSDSGTDCVGQRRISVVQQMLSRTHVKLLAEVDPRFNVAPEQPLGLYELILDSPSLVLYSTPHFVVPISYLDIRLKTVICITVGFFRVAVNALHGKWNVSPRPSRYTSQRPDYITLWLFHWITRAYSFQLFIRRCRHRPRASLIETME